MRTNSQASPVVEEVVEVLGHYRLSDKAVKREYAAWRKSTGLDPEHTRVLVVTTDRSKPCHQFFYVNGETNEVGGVSEYRRIDSYFTKVAPFTPTITQSELVTAADGMRVVAKELGKLFTVV